MLCAAMFYAGVSQSNNAAFVIGFVVASMVVMSALQGWGNLRWVRVRADLNSQVFAGAAAALNVELTNASKHPAYALRISQRHGQRAGQKCGVIAGQASWRGEVPVTFAKRGLWPIPEVEVSSVFPMAFFEFRRRFQVDQSVVVYPELLGNADFPEWSGASADSEAATRKRGGDDFAGVRGYLPGESQRHVDWKAVARGAPLMVKEFDGGWEAVLQLTLETAPQEDLEGKLSQLALWVVRAGREGVPFSLKLPGIHLPTHSGLGHQNACLEALALVAVEDAV